MIILNNFYIKTYMALENYRYVKNKQKTQKEQNYKE